MGFSGAAPSEHIKTQYTLKAVSAVAVWYAILYMKDIPRDGKFSDLSPESSLIRNSICMQTEVPIDAFNAALQHIDEFKYINWMAATAFADMLAAEATAKGLPSTSILEEYQRKETFK